mgnify:CR=1 FL=1
MTITNSADSASTLFNITGNNQADSLTGSNGNDTLKGGAGVDNLNGGKGDDTLTLNTGAATGSDADVVHFQTAANNGIDTIIDFKSQSDIINVKLEAAAGAFNNSNTELVGNYTAANAAGTINDNIIVIDVDDVQYDDATALMAGSTGLGSAIAGADARAIIVYGSSSATGESRVAFGTIPNAGGVTNAVDVGIIKGIKSEAGNFNAADFLMA